MQRPAMPGRDGWRALSPSQRRAVKAVAAVAIGLGLTALFGVWKTSALAIAAVILVLVVPRYGRLGKVGQDVVPALRDVALAEQDLLRHSASLLKSGPRFVSAGKKGIA